MDKDVIVSPDTLRKDRVPPGQRLTEKFPVLHHGSVPKIDVGKWTFTISGLIDRKRELSFKEFHSLPSIKVFSDIHCVTTWSRLNNLWEGVSAGEIKKLVTIRPEAKYVIVHAAAGFTTNLPIEDFFQRTCSSPSSTTAKTCPRSTAAGAARRPPAVLLEKRQVGHRNRIYRRGPAGLLGIGGIP